MARHRRIGLLGGSFNPAHGGHRHISVLALRHLALDEVWWLVSPQNPLKPTASMAPFADRLASARRAAAGHKRIRVSDIEERLGSVYTVDTMRRLRRRYPRQRFVWVMGGDNLAQIRHWRGWPEIFRLLPIAVFARAPYSLRALAGMAATRFSRWRVPVSAAPALAEMTPPAWVFVHTRLDARSATQIRAERGRSPTQKERGTELSPVAATISPLAAPRSAPQPGLLDLVLQTLEDGKAEDVVTIELAGKTVIADQMVIASGRSARQVVALTEHLEEALARRAAISVEGKTQADWVLIDAGDVIVHLFRPEVRAYYNLEKMWGADFPEADAAVQ